MRWEIRAAMAAVFVVVFVVAASSEAPDAAVGMGMSAVGAVSWTALAVMKRRSSNA